MAINHLQICVYPQFISLAHRHLEGQLEKNCRPSVEDCSLLVVPHSLSFSLSSTDTQTNKHTHTFIYFKSILLLIQVAYHCAAILFIWERVCASLCVQVSFVFNVRASHPHRAYQTCISIGCTGWVPSSIHMVMDDVCGTCQPPHNVKAFMYMREHRRLAGRH